jgi:hypothetical protein
MKAGMHVKVMHIHEIHMYTHALHTHICTCITYTCMQMHNIHIYTHALHTHVYTCIRCPYVRHTYSADDIPIQVVLETHETQHVERAFLVRSPVSCPTSTLVKQSTTRVCMHSYMHIHTHLARACIHTQVYTGQRAWTSRIEQSGGVQTVQACTVCQTPEDYSTPLLDMKIARTLYSHAVFKVFVKCTVWKTPILNMKIVQHPYWTWRSFNTHIEHEDRSTPFLNMKIARSLYSHTFFKVLQRICTRERAYFCATQLWTKSIQIIKIITPCILLDRKVQCQQSRSSIDMYKKTARPVFLYISILLQERYIFEST